jgi:phosphopantetheinyl transferase
MEIKSAIIGSEGGHIAGRRLLQELYESRFETPMPEIAVTPRGKPYFVDTPVYFSISHTPRHAFCVMTDRPVGMDAEELDRHINLRLAEKILSPGEKAQFDAAEDKTRALLTFWVLKEATVKCSGTGLTGFPNQTDFSLDDPRVQQIGNCLVAVITDETGDAYAF